MDGHELRSRPSSNASLSPASFETQDRMSKPMASSNGREDLHLLCPFNHPPTPEAAIVRIVQNLSYFWLFYTLVMWVGLSISSVTSSYLLLLRLLPGSSVLHRILGRRLLVVALVVAVELILADAGKHLVITMAIGTPIILVHALLTAREDLCFNEEAYNPGELFFLVVEKKAQRGESPHVKH